MKHPYSELKSSGLEIVCFLVGHKWKFPKKYYTELTKEEYNAITEKESHLHFPPNPYWHDATSWTAKCKRCRRFTNDTWPGTVWYKKLWWAIRASAQDFRWWFVSTWKNDHNELRHAKLLAFPMAILSAVTQFFAQMIDNTNFPLFPMDWVFGIRDSLYEKFYNKESDAS